MELTELENQVLIPAITDFNKARSLFIKYISAFKDLDKQKNEGFVIRVTDSFKYADFSKSLCKLVRANHVTSSAHWRFRKVIPNKLKENN